LAEPSTTAPEAGAEISRTTAQAATDCIDMWIEVQNSGLLLGYFSTSQIEATEVTCDDALKELDFDEMGSSDPLPPRATLRDVLESINFYIADTVYQRIACDFPEQCEIFERYKETFLIMDEGLCVEDTSNANDIYLPATFCGRLQSGGASIADIEALTVAQP